MVTRTLAAIGAATAACAALGTVATSSGTTSLWYRTLQKPPIQPPAVVFPIVWTALYTDVAISSAIALDALRAEDSGVPGAKGAPAYWRALAVNLVLNAGWSWTFFRWHRLGPAVAVAGALTLSSLDLARRARRVSPPAGLALLPYAAWCGFATALSSALWRRNR